MSGEGNKKGEEKPTPAKIMLPHPPIRSEAQTIAGERTRTLTNESELESKEQMLERIKNNNPFHQHQ